MLPSYCGREVFTGWIQKLRLRGVGYQREYEQVDKYGRNELRYGKDYEQKVGHESIPFAGGYGMNFL